MIDLNLLSGHVQDIYVNIQLKLEAKFMAEQYLSLKLHIEHLRPILTYPFHTFYIKKYDKHFGTLMFAMNFNGKCYLSCNYPYYLLK